MSSRPNLTFCRIGGDNGTKLTRIAFAVMVKFTGLTTALEQMLSEVEYASISLPEKEGTERDKAVLEVLQADPSFDKIINCWTAASKMRIWLNGKKQSLISRSTHDS